VVGVDRRTSRRGERDATAGTLLERIIARRLWILRESLTFAALGLSGVLAHLLRFEFALPFEVREVILPTVASLAALQYGMLGLGSVHRRSWRFTSLADATAVTRALVASGLVAAAVRLQPVDLAGVAVLRRIAVLPWSVLLGSHLLALLAVIALRAFRRAVAERQQSSRRNKRPGRGGGGRGVGAIVSHRAIVIGSGVLAAGVLREIEAHDDAPQVVAILSDDRTAQGLLIAGVPVRGRIGELDRVAREVHATMLILALDRPQPDRVRAVVARAQRIGLLVRIRPASPFNRAEVESTRLRDVSLEDLLNRQTVELDIDRIESQVRGRTVLVTGAGGSIGSELARQLLRYRPATLVLLDRSEVALWAIERELLASAPLGSVVPALVDIADAAALDRVLSAYPPSVVFHAAALKHVPLLERNVAAAVENNVFGTQQLVEASVRAGVTRFVLISSDKAVNPSSVMGATKLMAERVVSDAALRTGRDFVSVRFGNVLGSSGSVVPVFEDQIDRGGPVTVTDERMTRFFMTIPEACGLVLQAAVMGGPGAVQVLDMGEPVRIMDLARDLIRLRGLEPDVDIEVRVTGMRPGEKLHEELASGSEQLTRSAHPSVFIARGGLQPSVPLAVALERLRSQLADPADREGHVLRRTLLEAAGTHAAATNGVPTSSPAAALRPAPVPAPVAPPAAAPVAGPAAVERGPLGIVMPSRSVPPREGDVDRVAAR
jgi:FlaA1/EpsC-like NDP-sugar epimerase